MVDRFERFSVTISEISHYWHKIASAEMDKYGLKGTHAMYLVAMSRFPDGITAARLGALCGKDKADVSRAMSMLEKQGLIIKEGVNKNLYRALLKLTAKGKAAAGHVRRRAELAVDMAGGEISDEHREILYKALELIASRLQILSKEGLPIQ